MLQRFLGCGWTVRLILCIIIIFRQWGCTGRDTGGFGYRNTYKVTVHLGLGELVFGQK